jgi:hypothetical protein
LTIISERGLKVKRGIFFEVRDVRKGDNFMKTFLIAMLFSFTVLSGCGTSFTPVQPPVHDADIYPEARTHAGLTVAIDEIADPDRTRRYFGVDLRSKDILPVMIVFTNHDIDRFSVGPSDVLLLNGSDVIDPIPGEEMEKTVRGGANLLMQKTVIPPKGNYRGILFYNLKKRDAGMYGKVESLFTGTLTMRIVVTDLDSKERLAFGPFPLSGS